MRRFNVSDPGFAADFRAFLHEERGSAAEVDVAVAAIVQAVKTEGLPAVLRFAEQFDRASLTEDTLRVTADEIEAGAAACPQSVRDAIDFAAERIRTYHARQRPADAQWTDETGTRLGWRWTPLEAVGIYVPGGRAAYPSTVLMNAVPAKVAGVDRIAMVTPPGRMQPAVLAAAKAAPWACSVATNSCRLASAPRGHLGSRRCHSDCHALAMPLVAGADEARQ